MDVPKHHQTVYKGCDTCIKWKNAESFKDTKRAQEEDFQVVPAKKLAEVILLEKREDKSRPGVKLG